MVLRTIGIIILVAAIAAGSLFYVYGGGPVSAPGGGETDSSLNFSLPKSSDAAEAGKPLDLGLDEIPEVVAEIEGEPIKRDGYVADLERFRENMKQANNPIGQERFEQIKSMMLENYINTETLRRQAEKEKMQAPPEKVEASFTAIKKNFPSEDAFKQALAAQELTEAKVKDSIRQNLAIQGLVEKHVVSKIDVTDEQAREYYEVNKLEFEKPEQVHAAHILARFDSDAGPEEKKKAKEKIETVLERLGKGEDFAELARSVSEDPGTASNGGDLGFFGRGRMVPEFEEAAFNTEPGKVSGIVESRFGYHLVKVLERRPAGVLPFEEVKEDVRTKLEQEKVRDGVQSYVKKLREQMNVKVF
ncbi:MAG: peptidylprolyl isomerase [Candidatus Nitrospinota bacterium M3_3B_026]